MPNRRPRTALTFIGLGVVLLASIVVGQRIGDRALFGAVQRHAPIAGAIATPVVDPSSNAGSGTDWHRRQVVTVATDPGFPDPRVTPTPIPPPPAPKPTVARTPLPLPSVHSNADGLYTSPPLPLPLVSHDPSEFESPQPTSTP